METNGNDTVKQVINETINKTLKDVLKNEFEVTRFNDLYQKMSEIYEMVKTLHEGVYYNVIENLPSGGGRVLVLDVMSKAQTALHEAEKALFYIEESKRYPTRSNTNPGL